VVDDDALLQELADKLRQAHARVAALPVSAAEKASTTRRLLAISDAAKHDVRRAAQRLDAFVAELDVTHPSS
jgi:hypothetical protein